MLKNPESTKQAIVEWIRSYVNGISRDISVVIGISGGKDSSVTAALCAEALGQDRVLGVLMPDGEQSDIDDAKELVNFIKIPNIIVNIHKCTDAFKTTFAENSGFMEISQNKGLSKDSVINMAPRVRMTTLYAIAQSMPHGALVANTCNRSEDYVGYSTKFGDSAGDFSPLGKMLVEEVRQLGDALGLPDNLVRKTPSDGLSGLSDEDKLGFTYEVLDKYITTGICDDEKTKNRIDSLHSRNLHKLLPMPMFEGEEKE